MKKMYVAAAVAAFCSLATGCMSSAQSDETKEKEVRIMSYNIRNGKGMDEVTNLERTAQVILKNNPDILALQEIDSVTNRSKRVDVLKELAQKVSMNHVYAPAIEFDGGKYGIGMLSKEKPLGSRYLSLPGREEKRAFLIVEFEDYVYCCTHLSLTPEDQLLSLPVIKEALSGVKKPLFIAGDLNAHPDSELIGGLKKEFKLISPLDVYTYPAEGANETLDYIGVQLKDTAVVSVVSSEVVNEPLASDHRPVISVVKLAVD